MADFIYSVWFEDTLAEQDDQDREWLACITIEAESSGGAQEWGDALAHDRCARISTDRFLRSDVRPIEESKNINGHATLPRVAIGERAEDEAIGW